MTSTFAGVIPPIATPLTPDGQVDRGSLERLVGHLIAGGVDGIFALGSTGEAAFLSDADRDVVLDVVCGAAAGQVPVVAGCIETTTGRALGRVAAAEQRGVAAVVVTAPFYAIVGPAEIDRHFRAVGERASVPLLAYDIPVCVKVKLAVDQLLAWGTDGVIAGVKDSSGDDVSFRQLVLGADDLGLDGFAALTGHEVVVDGMLLAGASGSVPGLGNVDPAGYVRMHRAAAEGDWATARREQDRLTRLFRIVAAPAPDAVGATRGVGAFKTALMELGIIDSNMVSLPMRPLAGDEIARVREQLERADLVGVPA